MKTKDRQIGWHLFLVVVVFLLLMPIVFAISNSFKTMQEAFNTVFQVIPLHRWKIIGMYLTNCRL